MDAFLTLKKPTFEWNNDLLSAAFSASLSSHLLHCATEWMRKLNTPASDGMEKFHIHSVTDVTGFGLIGHAYEMAQGSNTTLTFNAAKVPVIEGTEELARQGMLLFSKQERNRWRDFEPACSIMTR